MARLTFLAYSNLNVCLYITRHFIQKKNAANDIRFIFMAGYSFDNNPLLWYSSLPAFASNFELEPWLALTTSL